MRLNLLNGYGGLYIVPLFALFSFAQRKERWDELPMHPLRWAGFVVAGLAAAAFWMASEFPRVSMACLPATLAMLVLAIYGWQRLRLILPVLTYSLLVVPPPDGLWAELTLFMRFLSTESARLFLHLLPIDLVRIEEFSIVLPLTDRRLMIADECSGVRSLLSLTTVGLWLIMDARCRTALKPLLVLAIPLIAHTLNTLRISFTVLLYSAELDQFADGECHRWTGYIALVAGLGILVAMIRWSERIIPYCARKLAEETPNYECLRACFSGAVVLVPMPRKAPLVPGGLWPSLKLCQAIQRQGLAQQVIPLLLRTKAIRKSATSSKGERPSPEEHFATLAVEENRPLLATGCHFIIVDDFITRGSTMLAAYTRLREAFPNSMISSFALVRTMSDVELNSIVAPVDGVITYKNGFLHREP